MGLLADSADDGARQAAELSAATPAGAARRAQLYAAAQGQRLEAESLGLTMNQWHDGSAAVYADDEPAPRPPFDGNPLTDIHISTYPGSRLPHAWLDANPTRRTEISTHDVAGHGAFCLFTGTAATPGRSPPPTSPATPASRSRPSPSASASTTSTSTAPGTRTAASRRTAACSSAPIAMSPGARQLWCPTPRPSCILCWDRVLARES